MYLQRALVNLRLGNYLQSAFDGRRAYNYLEENLRKYPNFPLSGKSYYTVQALLSSIPKNYKHLIQMLGFETDYKKALLELDKAQKKLTKETSPYYFYQDEVNIHRAVLMHKLTERYDEAYSIIKNATQDYKTNPLTCFLRGKMALDSKKTTEAIKILSHFAGPDCPIPYINYDIANAYLYMLNKKCIEYYAHFLKQSNGPGLFKDTYLKLAWWSYLHNDTEMTDKWLTIIKNGTTSVRAKDKNAVKEAEFLKHQNPILLKARIHFDGGFNEYTLKLLLANKEFLANNPNTKLEYYYRLGRIYYDTKEYSKALIAFENASNCTFNNKEYFIPVANYYIGNIYSNQLNMPQKAIIAYTKCLDYSDYPYEATYSYKSKQAIKELNS